MRRREAGRGAAPAGFVATKHSGGIGAPPGTNTSPCQELADRPAVAGNGKRGPMPETTAKKHALPAFGLLERVWRAERRQRVSARRHELPDLRFSARQPPHAPDAPGVAERSPHVCRSGATNSIPPPRWGGSRASWRDGWGGGRGGRRRAARDSRALPTRGRYEKRQRSFTRSNSRRPAMRKKRADAMPMRWLPVA
jgi:hypothetical protein